MQFGRREYTRCIREGYSVLTYLHQRAQHRVVRSSRGSRTSVCRGPSPGRWPRRAAGSTAQAVDLNLSYRLRLLCCRYFSTVVHWVFRTSVSSEAPDITPADQCFPWLASCAGKMPGQLRTSANVLCFAQCSGAAGSFVMETLTGFKPSSRVGQAACAWAVETFLWSTRYGLREELSYRAIACKTRQFFFGARLLLLDVAQTYCQ